MFRQIGNLIRDLRDLGRFPFQQRVGVRKDLLDSFLVPRTADLVQIREKRPCIACQRRDLFPEIGEQCICRLRDLRNAPLDLFQAGRFRGRDHVARNQAPGFIAAGA